jgi:hypothetical protein
LPEITLAPGRFRVRLRDEVTAGAVPLPLPRRTIWPIALITGAMFAIFAGVAWTVASTMTRGPVRDVFDLMMLLFQGFWLLGWSVGVFILGALTVFLFLYGEQARIENGRLIYVPRLGPLKIIIDYDLARVRNVRLKNVGNDATAQIRFDYDGRDDCTLGDTMPHADAERLADTIRSAAIAAGAHDQRLPEMYGKGSGSLFHVDQLKKAPGAFSKPLLQEAPAASVPKFSSAALIAANMVPLAGVLFFGWDLATVMVLFWAESAVIGFYTALKMAVTGGVWAIFGVVFFLGHFGGFMAMHFLFIYLLFIRGLHAAGPEPGVRDALLRIFVPLWIPLAALAISHGVSFVSNFLGRREYERTRVQALMAAPYSRIMVMQFTVIFGGWVVLLLKNPVPALALLVLIKTAMDLRAHRREHLAD